MAVIETKNLYFTYPDGTCALKEIDFQIARGEFVGILGANGSGKTTLLKVLNGLLKPAKGEVCLEGKNIKHIDKEILFSTVCTMFQNPNDQLFSPTVGEDIAFGPVNMGLTKEEVQKRTRCALEAVEMPESAEKAIHHLSFGQKKRICLAGVLAMSPEIMLLDEPTSGLDPMGVNSIMRLFKSLNKAKGITMIMATQSVDLVPLFIDRAIILNKGKIIRIGSPKEIFSEPEEIRQAKLRLPRIGHLFEILKKKDGFTMENMPLTIGEARHELKKIHN